VYVFICLASVFWTWNLFYIATHPVVVFVEATSSKFK